MSNDSIKVLNAPPVWFSQEIKNVKFYCSSLLSWAIFNTQNKLKYFTSFHIICYKQPHITCTNDFSFEIYRYMYVCSDSNQHEKLKHKLYRPLAHCVCWNFTSKYWQQCILYFFNQSTLKLQQYNFLFQCEFKVTRAIDELVSEPQGYKSLVCILNRVLPVHIYLFGCHFLWP